MKIVLTLAIVFVTFLAVALKPRRLSEAWAATAGAALLLALGLVTPHQALAAAWLGKVVLLALVAIVLLSRLIDRSGRFRGRLFTLLSPPAVPRRVVLVP